MAWRSRRYLPAPGRIHQLPLPAGGGDAAIDEEIIVDDLLSAMKPWRWRFQGLLVRPNEGDIELRALVSEKKHFATSLKNTICNALIGI